MPQTIQLEQNQSTILKTLIVPEVSKCTIKQAVQHEAQYTL